MTAAIFMVTLAVASVIPPPIIEPVKDTTLPACEQEIINGLSKDDQKNLTYGRVINDNGNRCHYSGT